MAVRIGIMGLGFMGKTHFDAYANMPKAEVNAICDTNPKKLQGDWSDIAGNIGPASKKQDLSGIATYATGDKLLEDPTVDVVDITLPTYLHAEWAVKAMKADKHVFCEKPMALSSADGKRMVDTARKTKRMLFVGQCIRFWPMYAKAREVIAAGTYGKVITAMFRRVSAMPGWSWKGWILDPDKSGCAALDLHIHDSDFILQAFGKPKAVTSVGGGTRKGRLDHIITSYHYKANQLISAQGAWEYAPGFGFEMSFAIAMEKATMVGRPDLSLEVHRVSGKSSAYKLPKADGWTLELRHFVDCVAKNRPSDVVTAKSALDSVKLVECEIRSARTGKTVPVRL